MCQIEPEGYCSVWQEHVVKHARKRHRCDGCHGFIQIGESYISHFSIFEGDANSEKACLPCEISREEFKKDHRWTPSPSSMHEYLSQCIDDETARVYNPETDRHHWVPNETALKWQRFKDEMTARRDAAATQVQS